MAVDRAGKVLKVGQEADFVANEVKIRPGSIDRLLAMRTRTSLVYNSVDCGEI